MSRYNKPITASPSPEEVKAARESLELSQQAACDIVYLSRRDRWSEYERGEHAMPRATWELFLLKTGLREVAA